MKNYSLSTSIPNSSKYSIRIKTIIDQISYPKIADIGTDHGYIPIFSCLLGKADFAIACDIRQAPLSVAKKNITSYNLSHCIQIRLGDGMSPILPKEVQCVTLSGLGGESIINILKNGGHVLQYLNQMVISPQSSCHKVRRFIHKIDWKITQEHFLIQNNRPYNFLTCQPGIEPLYSEHEYILGKLLIQKKGPDYVNYVHQKREKLIKIHKNACKAKQAQLNELIKIYSYL